MTTTTPLHPKAQPGRRIEFTYYRDLGKGLPPHPGIITGIVPEQAAQVKVRLDGSRSTLCVPAGYQGLSYLDEVTEVPDLPMGRFHPTLADLGGFEWDGVPVCEISDDILIALTWERRKAAAAMTAYFVLVLGIHDTPITCGTPGLRYGVGLFEWEPEDAEQPWRVTLGQQGDDQAVALHYLNT